MYKNKMGERSLKTSFREASKASLRDLAMVYLERNRFRLEGISVGQHTLVCQVMNSQKKPPLSRYPFSWMSLKLLLTVIGGYTSLSLKQLSENVVVLLALTLAEPGSELAAHGLRFRRYHSEGLEFNLLK